ncbi:MAG: hypothetical protein M5R40_03410 [Anaerolineae bacterium]|nr:hypothetical protein [Anaerolineae bacterium]
MRVFLSGVMQGSLDVKGVEDQSYRQRLTQALCAWRPDVEVVDPWAIWSDAVDYDMDRAARVLFEEIDLAAQADALVAYLPSASMGTALEMWSAYRAGVPIYTISPLNHNWVVNALSTRVFDSLEAFVAFVQSDGLLASPTGDGA